MGSKRELSARRAARRFGAIAAGALAVAAALIVAAAQFEFLTAGFHLKLAMLLGAVGTISVGVGLMALTFYSSRSGADHKARTGGQDDLAPSDLIDERPALPVFDLNDP